MITPAAKKALEKRDRGLRAWKAETARREAEMISAYAPMQALLARLDANPTDQWPWLVADEASWITANDRDTNAAILSLLTRRFSAAMAREGREFLDDPLPPALGGSAEPTPWDRIAALFTAASAHRQAALSPQKPRRHPLITLNLTGPADVSTAIATLEALLVNLRGSTPIAPVGAEQNSDAPASVAKTADADAPKRRSKKAEATAAEEPAPSPAEPVAGSSPAAETEAPAPEAAPAETEKVHTIDTVRAHLGEFAKAKGPMALQALLTKHGVKRLGDLDPAKFGDIVAEAVI